MGTWSNDLDVGLLICPNFGAEKCTSIFGGFFNGCEKFLHFLIYDIPSGKLTV